MNSMQDYPDTCAAIILAAGLGTRMKSNKAKVLHEISGRPMILYVTATAQKIVADNVVVVVGHQADLVQDVVEQESHAYFALQEEQLGTGHAVQCALPVIPGDVERIVILYGDVPLLRSETISSLIEDHIRANRDLTVLAVSLPDPTGYGRIIVDEKGRFIGIVEEADSSPEQKRITSINTGIYCVERAFLEAALPLLTNQNAQGEYYLTDIVKIGYHQERVMGVVTASDPEEVAGVNSLDELAHAEAIMERRMADR